MKAISGFHGDQKQSAVPQSISVTKNGIQSLHFIKTLSGIVSSSVTITQLSFHCGLGDSMLCKECKLFISIYVWTPFLKN